MKKSYIFIPLISILSSVSTTLPFATSCSIESSIDSIPLSIDGSDWLGRAAGTFAEKDYVIDQYTKTVTYISAANIFAENLVIPNEVWYGTNSYTVNIAKQCFMNNQNLVGTVEFNNATKSIPSNCFSSCRNITQIIMHNPPIEIGAHAFSNCVNLSSLVIRRGDQLSSNWTDQVISIGESAFESTKLTGDLFFGSTLLQIDSKAFYNCDYIKIVNLNYSSLESIGNEAFVDCFDLSELFLPKTIKQIGMNAFLNCSNLKKIFLPEDNLSFTILDGCFEGCIRLKGFNRVPTLIDCGKNCFYNAESLEQPLWEKMNVVPEQGFSKMVLGQLTIEPKLYGGPNDIKSYAFSSWASLHEIDVSHFSELPTWTGKNIFVGCGTWGTLYVNKDMWDTADEETKQQWHDAFSTWGVPMKDTEFQWHIETKK